VSVVAAVYLPHIEAPFIGLTAHGSAGRSGPLSSPCDVDGALHVIERGVAFLE
jgi:hypothetical protein